jgi:hypothetical protein
MLGSEGLALQDLGLATSFQLLILRFSNTQLIDSTSDGRFGSFVLLVEPRMTERFSPQGTESPPISLTPLLFLSTFVKPHSVWSYQRRLRHRELYWFGPNAIVVKSTPVIFVGSELSAPATNLDI